VQPDPEIISPSLESSDRQPASDRSDAEAETVAESDSSATSEQSAGADSRRSARADRDHRARAEGSFVDSEDPRYVIPRAEHPISRKNIAEEALRVMQRLNQHGYEAFLVGGAVRDLYLGKTPKDYDIATDARPSRLKKIFRNCRIIGRRFRIAHVYFSNGRILEVSTFRRAASDASPEDENAEEAPQEEPPQEEPPQEEPPQEEPRREEAREESPPERATELGRQEAGQQGADEHNEGRGSRRGRRRDRDKPRTGIVRAESGIILRDNAYGTPEEDARRRDLTINGLFYDLRTFAVLDYVDGVSDLQDGVVRMISEPDLSFREDPVRMIRALRHAARTDFEIEEGTLDAIYRNRRDILNANPSRLLEEILKDLRSGAAAPYFTSLVQTHVLDSLAPSLACQLRAAGPDHPFWRRIRKLDEWIEDGRMPTNAVLLAVLLHTVLFEDPELWEGEGPNPPDVWRRLSGRFRDAGMAFRVSRRDTERILQIVIAIRKLQKELKRERISKAFLHKGYLLEALDFLELELDSLGHDVDLIADWRKRAEKVRAESPEIFEEAEEARGSRGRRSGRRRGRRRAEDRSEQRGGDPEGGSDGDRPRKSSSSSRRRRRRRRKPPED